MKLSEERKGEIFVLLQAILWGFYPIITILSFQKLSPLVSLAWSSFFATIFFAITLSIEKKWHELKNTSALKDTLIAAFLTGIVCYTLSFFGLQHTSAGNASIISLTDVLASFLFFHIWRKDYISKHHIIGSILVVIGALIVLYPNATDFHLGDILILAAAFVAPFGNFFQRKARNIVGSESIIFVRSLISTVFIFFLSYALKLDPSYQNVKDSLFFLMVNGFLLLGLSKILWIEGIHRISVTKSSALSSTSPLLTLLFAWIFLKNSPTIWQLISFIPIFFGVVFLSNNKISNKVNNKQ